MKNLYTFLICLGLAVPAMAQQDSSSRSSLTLAAIYGNTANYFGQTTAEKLPYLLTNASYRLKSGFYVSASALKLLNTGGPVSSVDLGAGYGFNLSQQLTGGFSYTRSFYEKNSPLLQTANENSLSAELSLDHLFKSSVNADYAFGKQNDMFVTFSNSKLFDLGSLVNDKDFISLEPSISIIGGTQHFYQTYTTEKAKRKKLLDNIKNPLFPPGQQQPETTTTTVESTGFGLMAYSLSLPLAYNRASYTVEASYQLSVAGKKVEQGTDKTASIFNLSFYYMF